MDHIIVHMSDERGAPCVSAPDDCWNTVSRDIQNTDSSIQDTAAQPITAACTSLLQDNQQNLQKRRDTPGHLQDPAKQKDSQPPEQITFGDLASTVVEQKGAEVTLGQNQVNGKYTKESTHQGKGDLHFQGSALDPQSPVVGSVGYKSPLTSSDPSSEDPRTKGIPPSPVDTRTKGTRSPPSFQWTSCDLDTNLVFISSRETDHSDCTDTEDMVAKSDSFTDSEAEGRFNDLQRNF